MQPTGPLERSVLLLGSSLFSFSDSGAGGSLAALLLRRLQTTAPHVSWKCSAERLLENSRTASRTASLLDSYRPDAVVFEMTTYQFVHRALTTRIRRRWPRLYRPSLAAMSSLKRLAGNAFEGGTDLRGLLFRAPRGAAYRIFGGDVEQEVETSIAYSLAALDEMLRREHVAVVCSMPKFQWREPEMEWCRNLIGIAADALAQYCAQRHIPTYDVEKDLSLLGRRPGLAKDAIHYDRETRDFEAGLVSAAVLKALNV